jgi:hypothetical protein
MVYNQSQICGLFERGKGQIPSAFATSIERAVTVFRLDGYFCPTLHFEVKDLTSLRRCWVHFSGGGMKLSC